MPEKMAPILRLGQSIFGAVDCISSNDFSIPGSRMAGIESRNENLAAADRLSPSNSPAVMVIPERDVPGIRASACAQPMMMMSLNVRLCSSRVRFPFASDHHSAKPNKMVVVAMTIGDLSDVSMTSLNASPNKPTGIVPMITPQARRLLPVCFFVVIDVSQSSSMGLRSCLK